jgi:hypothetical protein
MEKSTYNKKLTIYINYGHPWVKLNHRHLLKSMNFLLNMSILNTIMNKLCPLLQEFKIILRYYLQLFCVRHLQKIKCVCFSFEWNIEYMYNFTKHDKICIKEKQ